MIEEEVEEKLTKKHIDSSLSNLDLVRGQLIILRTEGHIQEASWSLMNASLNRVRDSLCLMKEELNDD